MLNQKSEYHEKNTKKFIILMKAIGEYVTLLIIDKAVIFK